MGLTDETYIATSTYRKSGDPVTTATWIVPMSGPGDRFGFWTSSASGKVKRLGNNPRITVVPSNTRGRAKDGAASTEGTAILVTSGAEFDEVTAKVKKKYGFQVPMTRFFNTLGHIGKGKFPYGDVVVIVTPTVAPNPTSSDS